MSSRPQQRSPSRVLWRVASTRHWSVGAWRCRSTIRRISPNCVCDTRRNGILTQVSRHQLLVGVALTAGLALASTSSLPMSGAASRTAGVKACYKKKTGTVRVAKGRKACRRGERSITLNRQGSRGQRGSRGPAGPTGTTPSQSGAGVAGPEGPTGLTGLTGPTGPAGSTGPTGPSNSTEARNLGPVTITGTDGGSANSLVTQSGVDPGNYLLIARAQLNSVPTLASEITCEASLAGKSAQGTVNIGTNAGNSAHSIVTITFNVTVATPGSANLRCYRESLSGTAPTATGAYVELLQVGSATSQVVSS